MDSLISSYGEDGVLHIICDHLSDGMSPHKIAESEGITWGVLWKWVSADNDRLTAFLTAAKGGAVKMAYETIEIVDGANEDDVGVRKERAGARRWLSSKIYRDLFGEKQSIEVTGIDPKLRDLLEAREERLRRITERREVVIDNDSGELI